MFVQHYVTARAVSVLGSMEDAVQVRWVIAMPSRSSPVLQREALDPPEIAAVVGDNQPPVVQTGGGDEHVRDTDGGPLIEQIGVDPGGDSGAFGIEWQDPQRPDEAGDFQPFALALFHGRAIRSQKKLEFGEDGQETIGPVAGSQSLGDLSPSAQDIDADVGVENPFHSCFS